MTDISLIGDLYELTDRDVEKATEALTCAFFNDPGICFTFPDAETREKKSKIVWEMTIRDRIRYGKAFATTSSIEGVALWLHSDQYEMGLARVFKAISIKKMLALLSTFRSGMKMQTIIEKTHCKVMQKRPHIYLSTLAVDPAYQGKGYASKLVRPMLEWCTINNLPIYLETATENDVQLYLHYGFTIAKEIPIDKDKLIMQAMVYEPSS